MRSGNPPTSGVDHTLYGRLTLAGPEVRIHLPRAASPKRTRSMMAAPAANADQVNPSSGWRYCLSSTSRQGTDQLSHQHRVP
jgi:hypothetical protein